MFSEWFAEKDVFGYQTTTRYDNRSFIPQLVRVLWLANLAECTLLYIVAKMFRDWSPSALKFIASKSLKLSFTSIDSFIS